MENIRTQFLAVILVTYLGVGCAHREVSEQNESVMASESAGRKLSDPDKMTPQVTPVPEKNAQISDRTMETGKSPDTTAEYHFSLAQAYVAEGNPDRAIEEFKITLMYDSESSLVRARLAGEYIKKGMVTAAMETCKEALQRDPKFIEARLMLAGLYSAAREPKQALAEYEAVIKQDPKHEEATVYRAQVLSESAKAPEAVASLRAFLKRNPESALVWYYLGRGEQQQEHPKDAIVAFKKALEFRPNFTQASLALGYLYEEQHRNEDAIRVYSDLYEEAQDLSAASRLATIYLKQEKYKEAMPYLEAIQTSDSEDMNVRVKLGLVQMELKQYDRAVATFKEILGKNPESDRIRYYLGSLYEETKQFDLAVEELRKVNPDSKLYSDAALHVGYLMKQGGKSGEAKDYIKDAIVKSPRVPTFYIFQANLEEEGKNVPAAVGVLEQAVEKFPEDERVRYYLGSLYDRQGKADRGIEQMEAILKFNPKNVDAMNYIGYTWTQKGIRLDDAENLLKRALSLKPENAYIQDSWGWHLFVRGRVSQAVVQLEKAVKLKPNEPTILEHLADAYLRSNLREKAKARYEQAIRVSEEGDGRSKLALKLQNLETELAGTGESLDKRTRAPASVEPTAE
jgi:tetratricopeptide (TPR) repeat protein